ncbi:MAG: NifU family protein [Proteobacteria bacterium]|nr:NifU family protein [Pseudomonadota bacterium]
MNETDIEIDLSDSPMHERHAIVFDAWEAVEEKSAVKLRSDHNPRPLFHHFASEFAGLHDWTYTKEGPERWDVTIKKLETPTPNQEELEASIEAAIAEIRPYLQGDGGDIEVVEINAEDMSVAVMLTGACKGCPSAALTLKNGVETTIKKHVPKIREIVAVQATD